MLDYAEISRIVEKEAKPSLGKANVVRAFTEPGTDADGHDALRITIVITPEAIPTIDGDALLDNLLNIHDRLKQAGEERTPMVGYATEEELADSGDPQS
jgi:hypothetical protein